ncbi:hypothetical protein EXIGLDRAFT_204317 [Exidia glandulosa HHB12029]|uniref:Uncharacterized protein n=1 Tax=Exidia glandulosa HHB12029 TaxID=1314781 RepID=A0A165EMX9_EXIGL|nr:hypothetical protein EXIGLDRAFT_204317 [Exidia glandulosa HHB12029]
MAVFGMFLGLRTVRICFHLFIPLLSIYTKIGCITGLRTYSTRRSEWMSAPCTRPIERGQYVNEARGWGCRRNGARSGNELPASRARAGRMKRT